MGLVFLAIVVVGIGSYLARSLFILAWADRQLPDFVMVSLRYVAPAVLSALVITVLIDAETDAINIGIPEVVALLIGTAVAYKTRNHVWTLLIGMGSYWLSDYLVSLF